MLKEVKGDLTKATEYMIVHGCNCSMGWGAGVSGAIGKAFPMAEAVFRKTTNPILGKVVIASKEADKVIINAYTQQYYGRNPKVVYTDYDAIRNCVYAVVNGAITLGCDIAMPRLGCGLANGDWNIVKQIILTVLAASFTTHKIDVNITIYTL